MARIIKIIISMSADMSMVLKIICLSVKGIYHCYSQNLEITEMSYLQLGRCQGIK